MCGAEDAFKRSFTAAPTASPRFPVQVRPSAIGACCQARSPWSRRAGDPPAGNARASPSTSGALSRTRTVYQALRPFKELAAQQVLKLVLSRLSRRRPILKTSLLLTNTMINSEILL